MGKIHDQIKELNKEIDILASEIFAEVCQSEDKVSQSLEQIFERATPHTDEELKRAKRRKELGNPPGKASDTIGDELSWEQILSHFKGRKRLWIISRDGDYGTLFGGKGFINRFLYDELQAVSSGAEAFLFSDTVEGINHFLTATGVKAEKRLTPEEVEEIEKEEQSLPPLSQQLRSVEQLRRTIEAMSNLPNTNEQLRRTIEAMSNLPNTNEQLRRTMESMSNLPDIIDQLRRALRMSENFPPSDEEPESNDEDEANDGLEDGDEPDSSTDDEQPN